MNAVTTNVFGRFDSLLLSEEKIKHTLFSVLYQLNICYLQEKTTKSLNIAQ